MLGRGGEDLAPRFEQRALTAGRERPAFDAVRYVLQLGAHVRQVGRHDNLHGPRLLRGQIEHVKPAGVLEDDRVGSEAGPLHVVLGEICYLAGPLGAQLVGPDVELFVVVAVGEEVDRVFVPHGQRVGAGRVGELLRCVVHEVVEPQVAGHPAPVALPRAEFARDELKRDSRPVGTERGQFAVGQGKLLGQSASNRLLVELVEPT